MKHLFIFFIVCVFLTPVMSQTIGSKVSLTDANGKNYTGIITEIQDGKYKVKYDGFDFEPWLATNQFTVTPQAAPIVAKNEGKPVDVAQNYKVGDKVEVYSAGAWYPSQVLEVKPGSYKIHYIDWSSTFDTWVGNDLIRVAKNTGKNNISNKILSETKEAIKPEMNGALPKITGTSWSLLSIYTKGTEPTYMRIFPTYLFCNTGRWELQTSFTQMGTYKVVGNRLVQVHDGADKLTGSYKMTWNAAGNYLELDDGKLIFRLRYQIKAKC